MKIIRGLDNIKKIPKGSACSIGIFDGVHRGHLAILDNLIKASKEKKFPSLIITFYPHPFKIVNPRKEVPLLISLRHRLLILDRLGIGYCWVIIFDKKFAQISPIDFVEDFLYKKLEIKELYLGRDFRFGEGQRGDVNLLKKLSKQFKFHLETISPVEYRNKIISSSWIRKELHLGNLKMVKRLLGRSYSIYGKVKRGRGRGKFLGFPTANLDIEHEALPPCGVYLTKSYLDNRIYPSLLYVGHRPTFAEKDFSVEVYLLDFKKNIYGKFIEVEFIERIRGEKKFTDVSLLISAMEKDDLIARRFFSKNPLIKK